MYNWSTHQLTEYFTALSASETALAAIAIAVERSAELLEGEVGAVVLDGEILGCWGFGPVVPAAGLIAVAGGVRTLRVTGLGDLYAVPSGLGRDTEGILVIARLDEDFSPEERQLLQGMAQVLGLALRSIRVLGTERSLREERERVAAERLVLLKSAQTRQRLMETLLSIQRAISNRRPLPEILDAVTTGAADLLDGAVVALVLAEPDRQGDLTIASISANGAFAHAERPRAEAREAMATGTALIRPFDPERLELGSVIAAPVHVTGEMAGSLVAHLPGAVELYVEQRDQIAAFAQQVSLALADARTVEAVKEAHHDSLTGLPNRALFLKIFNRALAARGSAGAPTTVLFIDLDRFKAVNDSLGHEAGDQLLAAAAARIRGCVRSGDTTARLGGDEFAVLLHDSAVEAPTSVGERIITALKQPFRLGGRDAFVGASVGIALTRDASADSDGLLNNADVAMYRAKKEGRGKVVVFEPQMQAEALDYLGLRGDLQRALTDSEFRLQYQPLVRLDTGTIAGVESLIRWHSPTRGRVSPADFIPIAEDTGLIVDIGRWVLETAAAQVAQWRQAFPELILNVNVSGRQLIDPRFADTVARVLTSTGLPSSAVSLELTESVLMDDPDTALACLGNLKDLGVQLAIDDFGTGYSSLSYLRVLPVDELKIDRSFIARAELTGEDLAVVRTIIDLGHILGLRVVAEGIENEAQLDVLRDLGCGLGQGYHLCRPADPDDLHAVLARGALAAPAAA